MLNITLILTEDDGPHDVDDVDYNDDDDGDDDEDDDDDGVLGSSISTVKFLLTNPNVVKLCLSFIC